MEDKMKTIPLDQKTEQNMKDISPKKKIDSKNLIILLLCILLFAETVLGYGYTQSLRNEVDALTETDIFYEADTIADIDALRAENKPVIVVFGADYCPTCINYKPYVKEIAKLYGEEVIVKYVDTVDHEDIRYEYNIEIIPSTLFFGKDGTVYEPSMELEVMKSDEVVEERRYVSEQFTIAEAGELEAHCQFEFGMTQEGQVGYCKFVGLLDVIQLEEIILDMIKE